MLFMFIFVVLSLLVISNTYNIYRLTNIDFAKRSLMDLQEFDGLHPMLKEMYNEQILKGILKMNSTTSNDYVKSNNLDKWYNANKSELMELSKLFWQANRLQMKNNDSYTENIKIETSDLAKMTAIDLKDMIEKTKAAVALMEEGKYQEANSIYKYKISPNQKVLSSLLFKKPIGFYF